MHKKLAVLAIGLAIITLTLATTATAVDRIVDLKIDSIEEMVDSRGNPYVRVICKEQKTLQGVPYESGVPVLVFASSGEVDKAKTLKPGGQLKAIVTEGSYQGRDNYIVRKILE